MNTIYNCCHEYNIGNVEGNCSIVWTLKISFKIATIWLPEASVFYNRCSIIIKWSSVCLTACEGHLMMQWLHDAWYVNCSYNNTK